MFYELIFENGDNCVMSVEDQAEALEAIRVQHKRAMNGERALASDPNSPPASRIKRVLVYNKHPNEFKADQIVDTKEVEEAVKAMNDEGKTSIPMLVSTLRSLTDPLSSNPAPHDTHFLMREAKELDEKEWASV